MNLPEIKLPEKVPGSLLTILISLLLIIGNWAYTAGAKSQELQSLEQRFDKLEQKVDKLDGKIDKLIERKNDR